MPDPLPGPASGREYLAAQHEQLRQAAGLALSALRAHAYRGQTSTEGEDRLSRQRGDAIDALGLALGHTQLLAGPPAAELRRLYDPLHEPEPSMGQLADTLAVEVANLRGVHGERLDRLEQLIYGDPPEGISVRRQLDAQSAVLSTLAEQVATLADRLSPPTTARRRHDDGCALPDAHTGPCRDARGTDLTIPF